MPRQSKPCSFVCLKVNTLEPVDRYHSQHSAACQIWMAQIPSPCMAVAMRSPPIPNHHWSRGACKWPQSTTSVTHLDIFGFADPFALKSPRIMSSNTSYVISWCSCSKMDTTKISNTAWHKTWLLYPVLIVVPNMPHSRTTTIFTKVVLHRSYFDLRFQKSLL